MDFTTIEWVAVGLPTAISFATGTLAIIFNVLITRKKKRIIELEKENKVLTEKLEKAITPADSKAVVDFFDRILATKFQYYLNTHILAYFMSDKEIEKKEIRKLKDEFYMDVSKTLNPYQQAQILKVFSSTGTILYIHQTFLRMVNDANIKFKDSEFSINNASRRTLDAVYN